MSLKSNDFLRTIQKTSNNNEPDVRLATITQQISGKYKVQFYGEDAATEKTYMKIRGVSVITNKPVVMQKINGTYVIMGNVE